MEKRYVLLGHKMYVGGQTLFWRDTPKGLGGAETVDRATRFTRDEALRLAGILHTGGETRGWEVVELK
jgi:hypothetical protein